MSEQNARVWGEWYGGSNYAMSYPWEYLEVFESLEAAQEALVNRYYGNRYGDSTFNYVHKESHSLPTPAVSQDCEMWIWYENPIVDPEFSEHYPHAVIALSFENGEVTTQVAEA